jgi:tetratricopeptide (TPR) repeat protein
VRKEGKGERIMKAKSEQMRTVLFLVASLVGGTAAFGQAKPAQTPPPPAATPTDNSKAPQATPLTLDSTPPPVSAEEDAAIKAFRDAKDDDPAKKNQTADQFLLKYPQSRYRAEVYNWQVKFYLNQGQIDKLEATADKELELQPNDAQTLAIVGSTLPRAMNASTPDPEKRLAKAEQFCRKALDLLPTLPKPETMSDETFTRAKNQTAAMAYSGLGVVAYRRSKFADAIPDFEQSVKLDPQPDPVNYFLLGLANEKASHFDDAVAAFTKCAAMPGGMQTNCTQGAEEAKKLGATQLSAPK